MESISISGEIFVPFTNENYYEIVWKARANIFDQIILSKDNITDVLNEFVAFDLTHTFSPTIAQDKGGSLRFLSRSLTIKPEPIPDAPGQIAEHIRGETARMEFVAAALDSDTQAIVELGCGYGMNLFRLSQILGDREIRYIGAEVTQSGRDLCAKLAALPYTVPLQVEFIDHNAPDLSFLKPFDNVLIFTCHSIEQVRSIPDDYFSVLSKSAPKVKGVHLEPFGFQLENTSPQSKTQEELFVSKGWNLNFAACLLGAAHAGTVKVTDVRKDVYSVQRGNPTSVAVWESPA